VIHVAVVHVAVVHVAVVHGGVLLGAGGDRKQFHAALGAAAGLVAGDLRVHRAGVGDRPGVGRHGGRVVHLGDQRQHLVGRRRQPGVQLLAFGDQFGCLPQQLERRRRR
jgi:hypothetical protein